MRLAFFGDVVGKSGRDGLSDHLPGLRRDLKLDFVVVNAENAAGGFGITENTAREIFAAGADVLTLGNHSWDQREALTYIVRGVLGDAEAARRVLGVDHHEIQLQIATKARQVIGQSVTPGFAHHIAEESQSHTDALLADL